MNHINVRIPVFESRCHILYPFTKKEADAWLRKRKYEEEALEDCYGFTCYSTRKGNGAAIFLKKWDGSIKDIAILVHELVHASMFIRSELGVDETDQTAEVLCYLTDFLTQAALKKLKLKP